MAEVPSTDFSPILGGVDNPYGPSREDVDQYMKEEAAADAIEAAQKQADETGHPYDKFYATVKKVAGYPQRVSDRAAQLFPEYVQAKVDRQQAEREQREAEAQAATNVTLKRLVEEDRRYYDSFDEEGRSGAERFGEIKRPQSEITKYENLDRGALTPSARMYAENPDLRPPNFLGTFLGEGALDTSVGLGLKGLGVVGKAASPLFFGRAAKEGAEQVPVFYSHLDEVLGTMKHPIPVSQLEKTLVGKGVKKGELRDVHMSELAERASAQGKKSLTGDEIAEYVNEQRQPLKEHLKSDTAALAADHPRTTAQNEKVSAWVEWEAALAQGKFSQAIPPEHLHQLSTVPGGFLSRQFVTAHKDVKRDLDAIGETLHNLERLAGLPSMSNPFWRTAQRGGPAVRHAEVLNRWAAQQPGNYTVKTNPLGEAVAVDSASGPWTADDQFAAVVSGTEPNYGPGAVAKYARAMKHDLDQIETYAQNELTKPRHQNALKRANNIREVFAQEYSPKLVNAFNYAGKLHRGQQGRWLDAQKHMAMGPAEAYSRGLHTFGLEARESASAAKASLRTKSGPKTYGDSIEDKLRQANISTWQAWDSADLAGAASWLEGKSSSYWDTIGQYVDAAGGDWAAVDNMLRDYDKAIVTLRRDEALHRLTGQAYGSRPSGMALSRRTLTQVEELTSTQGYHRFMQADAELSKIPGGNPKTTQYGEKHRAKGPHSNYREIIIRAPKEPGVRTGTKGHWIEDASRYDSPSLDDALVHMRVTDRVDDQGRKILFVDEVQSDWHQRDPKEFASRMTKQQKEGLQRKIESYKHIDPKDQEVALTELAAKMKGMGHKSYPEISDFSPKSQKIIQERLVEFESMNDGVPVEQLLPRPRAQTWQMVLSDMKRDTIRPDPRPEWKNQLKAGYAMSPRHEGYGLHPATHRESGEWRALAMKRVMREAVDGGYDAVVIAPGHQVTSYVHFPEEKAAHFYDKLLPGEARSIVGYPKYIRRTAADGTVEKIPKPLPTTRMKLGKPPKTVPGVLGFMPDLSPNIRTEEMTEVPMILITPEIRARLSEPQKLYSAAPIIGAGAAAAAARRAMSGEAEGEEASIDNPHGRK